jgi:hypothetical protein
MLQDCNQSSPPARLVAAQPQASVSTAKNSSLNNCVEAAKMSCMWVLMLSSMLHVVIPKLAATDRSPKCGLVAFFDTPSW